MIKPILLSLLSATLLACASDGGNTRQHRDEVKTAVTDISYKGKARVFPAEINGAPAFSSLASSSGQSDSAKAIRYFLNAEQNKTNASVTLYLLSTLGNGDTVAAQTETEVKRWAASVAAKGQSFRLEQPDEVYNSELGGVDFYFGESIQNHITAYDLYMAEVNNRLVQIRLVGPATRKDRMARREIVSQIAEHLASN
jgi:hypothetical protein